MPETLESIIDAYIRPALHEHGGDMEVLEVADGVVRFRLTGRCSGCPAAAITTEELIRSELTQRLPGITDAVLVQQVSDDLISQARKILREHHV